MEEDQIWHLFALTSQTGAPYGLGSIRKMICQEASTILPIENACKAYSRVPFQSALACMAKTAIENMIGVFEMLG